MAKAEQCQDRHGHMGNAYLQAMELSCLRGIRAKEVVQVKMQALSPLPLALTSPFTVLFAACLGRRPLLRAAAQSQRLPCLLQNRLRPRHITVHGLCFTRCVAARRRGSAQWAPTQPREVSKVRWPCAA